MPTPVLIPPTVTVTVGAQTPIVTAIVPAGVQTVTVYQSPNGVTVVVPTPTPAVTIFVYPNGAPAPSPTPSSNSNAGSGAIRGTGTLCLPGDEDEKVPGGEKLRPTPANAVTLCAAARSPRCAQRADVVAIYFVIQLVSWHLFLLRCVGIAPTSLSWQRSHVPGQARRRCMA